MLRANLRRLLSVAASVVVAVGLIGACGSSSSEPSASTTSTTEAKPSGPTGPTPDASVRTAQLELALLGCQPGPIDGELGPDTVGAVRSFQAAAGLTADGIIGPRTRAALTLAARDGEPKCPPTPTPTTQPAATTTTAAAPTEDLCTSEFLLASDGGYFNNPPSIGSVPGYPKVGPITCGGPVQPQQYFAAATLTYCLGYEQQGTMGDPCPLGKPTQTQLWVWSGADTVEAAWVAVDASVYCSAGEVPAKVAAVACSKA